MAHMNSLRIYFVYILRICLQHISTFHVRITSELIVIIMIIINGFAQNDAQKDAAEVFSPRK